MLIAFASNSKPLPLILIHFTFWWWLADNNKFIEPSIFILVSRVAFHECLYVNGNTSIFISNAGLSANIPNLKRK